MKTKNINYYNEGEMPKYISVISSSQCARIEIDQIMVVEQEGRKLHIITPDRDYSVYQNIRDIIPSLAGRAFYRPIKGLIINLDHVRDISGHDINFYTGQTITLGKNSIGETRKAFKQYLRKYPPYSLWEPKMNVAERAAVFEIRDGEEKTEKTSKNSEISLDKRK